VVPSGLAGFMELDSGAGFTAYQLFVFSFFLCSFTLWLCVLSLSMHVKLCLSYHTTTYCRPAGCVQTYRPPVSEYKVVREKASAEHRDIERALTRFIAKTGDTENLFSDDPYAFPRKLLSLRQCCVYEITNSHGDLA